MTMSNAMRHRCFLCENDCTEYKSKERGTDLRDQYFATRPRTRLLEKITNGRVRDRDFLKIEVNRDRDETGSLVPSVSRPRREHEETLTNFFDF